MRGSDKKRIVISATVAMVGGLGSYLALIAEDLQNRGWEVHLITTNDRGDLFGPIARSATCHDLSGIPLSWKKVFAAAELLEEISPDILLMNHVSLLHYTLPLLGSGIKPIAVIHSDDPRYYRTAALFSGRIFRWIAPSPGLAENAAAYLPKGYRNRLRMIPHGVQQNFFCADRKGGIETGQKITFVGYLGATKGADLLPHIMQRVLVRCPNARLTLIGDGPLRIPLEQEFRERQLLDCCEFAGALSRGAVAEHLRESAIFLLPTKLEGFGLAVVEAMMSGAVPVVSRLKGVTDTIIDEDRTGSLMEPGDVEGFAERIVFLLKDTKCLSSMSVAARETAVKRFSAEEMLNNYEALFSERDDRLETRRRSYVGWIGETAGEVLRKGIDRRWLANRTKGIWE